MTPEQMFSAMVADGELVIDELDRHAVATPEKIFIIYGEEDRRVSFAAFVRESEILAAGLQALGVAPDDRVSVFSRNAYLCALSMFAIWRAGAVYCPVNFLYRGKLLAHQLSDTGPTLVISDATMCAALAEVADAFSAPLVLHRQNPSDHDYEAVTAPPGLVSKTVVDLQELLAASAASPKRVVRRASSVANIVYTSGTTGVAKGVVQPFRWMNQYTFPYRQLMSADDVVYCDLPLYHVGGAFYLLAKAAWKGATIALYDRFSPKQFWARIAEAQASHCVLLDVMTPWLTSAEPTHSDPMNTLNKVHMQPLPLNHNAVARRFGIDFVTAGFGQTESGLSFLSVIEECPEGEGTPAELWRGLAHADLKAAAQACGLAWASGASPLAKGFMGKPSLLFDAAVVDADETECADGAAGQLVLRPRFPDLILKEYFNRPDATEKAMTNGWFHTGDACYRDATGIFHFVDRMGDVFRIRGENVSSFQVEDLLNAHERIRSVAAVAIAAEEGDEHECAVFVQLIEDAVMDEAELLAFARSTMPKYMVPKHVRFVDALPVTPTNKIEKYKLRESLLAERRGADRA